MIWIENHDNDTKEGKNGTRAIMQRLAEYEDTKLTPTEINTIAISQIRTAKSNVELQREIEQFKEKLESSLKDMKHIVDAVRQRHCDDTCCFACAYDCDTSILPSGDYANECPGFDSDNCFKWRGEA